MSDNARQAELAELAMVMALLDTGQVGDARERIAAVLERAGVAERVAAADAPTADAPAIDATGDGLFGEPFDEAGPFGGQLDDSELDGAFESAESQREEMLDVNQVAQEAIRFEELGAPETLFSPEEHPNFATETMAELLERQGDPGAAARIRVTLGEPALGSAPGPAAEVVDGPRAARQRIIVVLERWLEHIASLRGVRT